MHDHFIKDQVNKVATLNKIESSVNPDPSLSKCWQFNFFIPFLAMGHGFNHHWT